MSRQWYMCLYTNDPLLFALRVQILPRHLVEELPSG